MNSIFFQDFWVAQYFLEKTLLCRNQSSTDEALFDFGVFREK